MLRGGKGCFYAFMGGGALRRRGWEGAWEERTIGWARGFGYHTVFRESNLSSTDLGG